eukprot:7953940-Alexandrium_andersonii.AAC.1
MPSPIATTPNSWVREAFCRSLLPLSLSLSVASPAGACAAVRPTLARSSTHVAPCAREFSPGCNHPGPIGSLQPQLVAAHARRSTRSHTLDARRAGHACFLRQLLLAIGLAATVWGRPLCAAVLARSC